MTMALRKHQSGMTMISWILLIGLIGFVGIFGFKLVPVYMDYFTINKALITVQKNMQAGESAQQIRSSIDNLFDVNSVNSIKPDDIEIKVDPDTKAVVMNLNYDARTNFIANIDLVVHFEKSYSVGH